MAREWDEPRGRRDERRDWRRAGRPDDPGRYARDEERRYDTPSRGASTGDAADDFGYERQAGDYRGRGGFAPRSEMDPQFRRDFGGQDFGTHDPNRFDDDDERRPMRREFDDRDRGVRDPRPVRGGSRYGSEMGVDYDRYAGQGGYGGRAGLGSGYLGRGYTGEGERDWRDRPRHRHDPRERSFWDRTTDEVSSWFGDEEARRRRDADHVGRGPKNYKRSDSRILEDINDRLSDDPYLDASDLEVRVQNGEATIDGTVDSRASKRRAEDIVESVSGVTHCQNNLRVRRAGRDDPAAGTGSTTSGAMGSGGAQDRQRH